MRGHTRSSGPRTIFRQNQAPVGHLRKASLICIEAEQVIGACVRVFRIKKRGCVRGVLLTCHAAYNKSPFTTPAFSFLSFWTTGESRPLQDKKVHIAFSWVKNKNANLTCLTRTSSFMAARSVNTIEQINSSSYPLLERRWGRIDPL